MSPPENDQIKVKLCTPEHYDQRHHLSPGSGQERIPLRSFVAQPQKEPHLLRWRHKRLCQQNITNIGKRGSYATSSVLVPTDVLPTEMMLNRMTPINKQSLTGSRRRICDGDTSVKHNDKTPKNDHHSAREHKLPTGTVISRTSCDYKNSQQLSTTCSANDPSPVAAPSSPKCAPCAIHAKDDDDVHMSNRVQDNVIVCDAGRLISQHSAAPRRSDYSQSDRLPIKHQIRPNWTLSRRVVTGSNADGQRDSIKRSRNAIALCLVCVWLLFTMIASFSSKHDHSICCVSKQPRKHNCSTDSFSSSSLFFGSILVSATRQQPLRKFHSWNPVNSNQQRLSTSTTVLPPHLPKRMTLSTASPTGGGDLSASDSLVSETVHSMALDNEEALDSDQDYDNTSTELPDETDESDQDDHAHDHDRSDKANQHNGQDARDMETAPLFSSRPYLAPVQSLPLGSSQTNQCKRHYAHLKKPSRRRSKQGHLRALMDTLLEQRIIIETEQLELFLRLRPSTVRYDFASTDGEESESGAAFGTTMAPPQATTPSREEREEAGEQCLNMLMEQFQQSRTKLFELSTTTFNVSCHVVTPGTQLQCALLTFDIHHFSSIFRSQKEQFCGMTSVRFNLLDDRCQLSLSIKRIDAHKKSYSHNKWSISGKLSQSLPAPITSSVWNLLHEVSPSYHSNNPGIFPNSSATSTSDSQDPLNCATLCHNLGPPSASSGGSSSKSANGNEVRRRFNPGEMIVLENVHSKCSLYFDPGKQKGKNKPSLQSLLDSSSSSSSSSLSGSLSQSGSSLSPSASSLSSFSSLSDLATKKSCIELSRHILTHNGLVIQHPTLKLIPLPLSTPLDVIEGQPIAPLDFFLKLDSKDKTSNVPYLDLVLKKYKWTASVSLLYPDIYPGILVGQTNVPVQSAHSEGPIPDFVSSAYFRFRFSDLKITKWGYRYLLKVSLKSNPACYTIETTYGPFNVRPKISTAVVLSPNTSDVNFATSKCHNIRMELQTAIIMDRNRPANFGHLSAPIPVSRQIDYVCDLNLEKLSSFLINFLANRAASSQSEALPFQMKTPLTANRIRKAFTVRRTFEFEHENEPPVLIRDFVQRGKIAINGSQCLEMSLHAPSIDDLNQSINNGTGFETFNGAFVAFQRTQLKQKLINMTFIYSGELLLKIRQIYVDESPVWEPPPAPAVTPATTTTPRPRGRFNRKQQKPLKPFEVASEVERNVLKRKSNFSVSEFDEFDTEFSSPDSSLASSSSSSSLPPAETAVTQPDEQEPGSSSTTTTAADDEMSSNDRSRSIDTSTTSRSPSTRSRNTRPVSPNGRQSLPKSSTSGFGTRNRPPTTPHQHSTIITKRPTTSSTHEIETDDNEEDESDAGPNEKESSEMETEADKSSNSSFFSGNKSIMWIAILFANTLLVFLFVVCFILCYYKRSNHEKAVPVKSRKPLKPFPDERRKDSNLFMLDKSDYSSNDDHSFTSGLDGRQRQNGYRSEAPYLKQHAEKVQQMQRVTRRLGTGSGTVSTEFSDHREKPFKTDPTHDSSLAKHEPETAKINKPEDNTEEGRASSKDSGHEDGEEEMILEEMMSQEKSKANGGNVDNGLNNDDEDKDRKVMERRLSSQVIIGEDPKRVPDVQFGQRALPRIVEEDVDHEYEEASNEDNGGRDSFSDQWLPNLPGFIDSEASDSRNGSRLSQFASDFRDGSPDMNYSLKGEDDEDRKYYIYNVRDVNMIPKKECLGKITVPSELLGRNSRSRSRSGIHLTLDELRAMIRQSSDEALQEAAKSRFRYLSESYHLVATDESSTPVDSIYPTKGVFIKMDNENPYSMAKMNNSLTARLQSEYERRFGPIVPRKVPKTSQRMKKWDELSQTKEQKERAAQKEIEAESVFPAQKIRARIEAEQAETEKRLARRDKRRIAASTNFRYDSYEFQNGQAKDRTNQGWNSHNSNQYLFSRTDSRNSSFSLVSSMTRSSPWVPGPGARSPRPDRASPKQAHDTRPTVPQPYLFVDPETGLLQRSPKIGRSGGRPPWRF